MTRRKVWLGAAVLFCLVNLAGAVMAAAAGELLHAEIHAGLLLLGAYYVRRIRLPGAAEIAVLAVPEELIDRLSHIELSVEALALGVERIGEGQRFITRFLAENDIPLAPGEGVAEPIEINAREETPQVRRL